MLTFAIVTRKAAPTLAFLRGFNHIVNTDHIDIDAELMRLEKKIESLTAYCNRLGEENRSLKLRFETWSNERAQLVEKTAIAKNRVEAMISRLKSMGHEL